MYVVEILIIFKTKVCHIVIVAQCLQYRYTIAMAPLTTAVIIYVWLGSEWWKLNFHSKFSLKRKELKLFSTLPILTGEGKVAQKTTFRSGCGLRFNLHRLKPWTPYTISFTNSIYQRNSNINTSGVGTYLYEPFRQWTFSYTTISSQFTLISKMFTIFQIYVQILFHLLHMFYLLIL